MKNFISQIEMALPQIVWAIVILLIGFLIATLVKKLVVKLLNNSRIPEKLASAKQGSEVNKMSNLLGNLAFLLVFILFLPSVFDKLGLQAISSPLGGFLTTILNYIPRLIAAIVILYIGFFVAKIVREVVETLLARLGIDSFVKKHLGDNPQANGQNQMRISSVLANIVYAFIVVPLIIISLDILNLQVIADPARQILSDFLGYVPKLFVAGLLIFVGMFIARLIANLLESVLKSVNTDGLLAKVGISTQIKLSELISKTVMIVLMLVFTVEAFNVLQLQVLQSIGAAIITYIPFVLSAGLILLAAYALGNFLETKIRQRNSEHSVFGKALKFIILAMGVFMALTQLGFAKNIVEYAFILLLGALAVAFALAFGLGGKDYAKTSLERMDRKVEEEKRKDAIK